MFPGFSLRQPAGGISRSAGASPSQSPRSKARLQQKAQALAADLAPRQTRISSVKWTVQKKFGQKSFEFVTSARPGEWDGLLHAWDFTLWFWCNIGPNLKNHELPPVDGLCSNTPPSTLLGLRSNCCKDSKLSVALKARQALPASSWRPEDRCLELPR